MTHVEAARLFREMADAIEANPALFGGAFLIVPPGDFEPIDGLPLTSRPNAAVFFSAVEGQLGLAIEHVRAAARSFR